MTVGKGDPNYAAALAAVRRAAAAVGGTDPATGQPFAEGYDGLPTELPKLQEQLIEDHHEVANASAWFVTALHELTRLTNLAGKLTEGEQRLLDADNRLVRESARLSTKVAPLGEGMARLSAGATLLAGALSRLTGGTETLQSGLSEGFHSSYPLQSGLRRASVRIVSTGGKLNSRAARLNRRAPHIFDSGYFVLSALDGAKPALRARAAEGIDLEHGGQAYIKMC